MRIKNNKRHFLSAVLFLMTLLLSQASIGQSLQRKAMLGIRMSPLTEEKKKQEKFSASHGILISGVNPSGTLGKMGVSKGMILEQINNTMIQSRNDVRDAMKDVREGDELKVTVYKDGKSNILKGTSLGKPLEKHPNAEVHYDVVSYKNNQLRSILYTPKNVEKAPVVFYLQGFTCQSIEYPNSNPIKKLLNAWIDAGYAVYLVEKQGMGDSKSKTNCVDIDFPQEMKGFSKAYKELWKSDKIDKDNIFLYGHSMGGVVAPILAQQKTPKGVMVYGTVGKSWYEYMKDVFTEQQEIFGSPKENIEENKKYNFPFITDLMKTNKPLEKMLVDPAYNEYLKTQGIIENLSKGYYMSRHYTFWRSLGDLNIPKEWSKVKANVYVMHGELDIQAIHARYAKMIVDNVNSHKGKAKFSLLPKTDHVFLKFDSMEDNVRALTNGNYRKVMRTNYNPEVATYSLKWMNSLVNN